ncbi:uncharacterized protein LOC141823018 [Curcuma longa]|uniref:uncharacterized protein LOC141823018 n=1 Tax=Curcuma longa TaxID=136217 RepID=UPI003D9F603A
MATEKESGNAKQLAHPSLDQEAAAACRWRSAHYLRRRRCAFWCFGCFGAAVIVLGITALVLALTLFKVKDPEFTINSLSLAGSHFAVANGAVDDDVLSVFLFNFTFEADVSLKNPNVASFRFGSTATTFFYEETAVGVAYAPAGEVGADRTVRMTVRVDVMTNPVARRMNVTAEKLVTGVEVELKSLTEVQGRMKVWGMYKRDLDVKVSCDITLQVSMAYQGIKNTRCSAAVE